MNKRIVDYNKISDSKKNILIIEFDESINFRNRFNIPQNLFLKDIQYSSNTIRKKSRIIFYTKDVFKINIFPVGGISNISPKLIVTFFREKKKTKLGRSKQDKKEKLIKTKIVKSRSNIYLKKSKIPIIVVIDPGHGGKDPGAISINKKYEKDIVFDIAKRVKRKINNYASNYIKVVLTRKKDKFIPLEDRLKYADKTGTDIFVSIHANASKTSRSRGIEIYYKGKATDREAKILEHKENAADLTGIKNFNNIKNITVTKILLDMKQSKNLQDSSILAEKIMNRITISTHRYYSHKQRGIKRAEFFVLQSIKTPSVLIEVGFITNKIDNKLLEKKWYREMLANSIATGILDYFVRKSSEYYNSLVKIKSKIKNKKMLTYKVKKGDTLSGIAKKFEIDFNEIKQINNLKNVNSLRIGQKIILFKNM